jgi:hypothetical protein
MSPNWFLRWRLRRAERALSEARSHREARDLENPDYGGLFVEQLAEERLLEQRIADLKQRLEGNMPADGSYCLKCGNVTPWHPKRGCAVCSG